MSYLEDILKTSSFKLSDGESYLFYDLDQVGRNIAKIKGTFKKLNQIFFSLKANPSPYLLNYLTNQHVNFDVSSVVELKAAISANHTPERITVSGPAKSDEFLDLIMLEKIKAVHLDAKEEYEILKSSAVPFTLRWPLESGYSQKVGLPKEDIESIALDCSASRPLLGIHIYVGRERANSEMVKQNLADIKKFILSHPKSFVDRPVLFWGAGLPMLKHIEKDFFPDDDFFEINLECGRALIHDCGHYVTQVLETKEKNGEKIVILNGGLQHLASHFGSPRFGQQDVTVSDLKKQGQNKIPTNIYGSLGITTDLLMKDVLVSESITRGDWLILGPAGSYGYTAGTNQFLGPNAVNEIFVHDKSVQSSVIGKPSYLESGVYEFKNS